MKKILMIVGALIVAAAIAAGSFYGGMAYQRSQANAIRDNFLRSRGLEGMNPDPGGFTDGRPGNLRGASGGFLGGGITGQVKSILGDTLILSTPQSEIEVSLSEATLIQKTSAGTTADLQPDQQVMVTGERDAQGHITAIRVLILNTGQPATEATP